jgi:hypothetical protein
VIHIFLDFFSNFFSFFIQRCWRIGWGLDYVVLLTGHIKDYADIFYTFRKLINGSGSHNFLNLLHIFFFQVETYV